MYVHLSEMEVERRTALQSRYWEPKPRAGPRPRLQCATMSALRWPCTRSGATCAPPGRLPGPPFAPGVAHTAGRLKSFAPGRAPARSSAFKGRGRWVIGSAMVAGKSALVPIGTGSEEMEAVIIIDVLRRAGVEVTVASVEDSLQVEMSRKVKLVADRMIGECADCSYDVVALPVRPAPRSYS